MYLVGNHCGHQSNLGDQKVFHPFIAVSDLWGSIVQVKYLGEEGAATPIGAAAAVCCPWDLVVCPCF
jgi:predicted alpha/beta-fold hydrolase